MAMIAHNAGVLRGVVVFIILFIFTHVPSAQAGWIQENTLIICRPEEGYFRISSLAYNLSKIEGNLEILEDTGSDERDEEGRLYFPEDGKFLAKCNVGDGVEFLIGIGMDSGHIAIEYGGRRVLNVEKFIYGGNYETRIYNLEIKSHIMKYSVYQTGRPIPQDDSCTDYAIDLRRKDLEEMNKKLIIWDEGDEKLFDYYKRRESCTKEGLAEGFAQYPIQPIR